MKKIYSPWRSAYIQSFSEKKHSQGCLFCRMVKQTADADNMVICRGRFCFAVLNKYPYNSGHIMVVPYRHTSRFAKITSEEHSEIMLLTARCISALEHVSKPHGFNFGANLGKVAGAGIDKHIHFHIVPRWNGDTNFMPVIAETKVISQDIKKAWKSLKNELKKI